MSDRARELEDKIEEICADLYPRQYAHGRMNIEWLIDAALAAERAGALEQAAKLVLRECQERGRCGPRSLATAIRKLSEKGD